MAEAAPEIYPALVDLASRVPAVADEYAAFYHVPVGESDAEVAHHHKDLLSTARFLSMRLGSMGNESLTLIVTAQCNLSCSYCYQNAKNARKAEWNVVQAGIDLAFGKGSSQVDLMFIGGEPLLEFDLLRRTVSYAEALDPGRKHFRFALSTNGTLITETVANYLDEHGIGVRLSFDGVQTGASLSGPRYLRNP